MLRRISACFLVWVFVVFAICRAEDVSVPETPVVETDGPQQVRLSLTHEPSTEMMITWLSLNPHGFVEYYPYSAGSQMPPQGFRKIEKQPSMTEAPLETMQMIVHSVILRNLLPGTLYKYRVANLKDLEDTAIYSAAFDFRTYQDQPKNQRHSSDSQIAIFSDMGTWGDVVGFIDFLAKAIDVEFAFHLGDLSYGKSEEVWNKWGRLVEPVAARIPYMVLPGNWDAKMPWMKLFRNRFKSPLLAESATPFSYHYAVNYHQVSFIMVNSYENYTKGSEQYEWLEKELKRANADRRLRPWVVVGFHSPIYSSSSGHGGGDQQFQAAVEDLLVREKVDLCFTGHDHGYERSYPVNAHVPVTSGSKSMYIDKELPIHLLVGVAGATQDPWMDPPPNWSLYRENGVGYVKLHVFDNCTMHVQLLRWNHTIGDEFWLVKDKTGPDSGSRFFPANGCVDRAMASSSAIANRTRLLYQLLLVMSILLPAIFVYRYCSRRNGPPLRYILRPSWSSSR